MIEKVYRDLLDGEIIRVGDEGYVCEEADKEGRCMLRVWTTVTSAMPQIGKIYHADTMCRVRRLVDPRNDEATAGGWKVATCAANLALVIGLKRAKGIFNDKPAFCIMRLSIERNILFSYDPVTACIRYRIMYGTSRYASTVYYVDMELVRILSTPTEPTTIEQVRRYVDAYPATRPHWEWLIECMDDMADRDDVDDPLEYTIEYFQEIHRDAVYQRAKEVLRG